MPTVVDVVSQKFFNQGLNGVNLNSNLSNFTPNLVGNVGEKIRAEFTIIVYWFSDNADATENWEITNTSGTEYTISRDRGSFIDDGFAVGDYFVGNNNWENRDITGNWAGDVLELSQDGAFMKFDLIGVVTPPTGAITDNMAVIAPLGSLNQFDAGYWGFGLIENQDQFSTESLFTNEEQTYYGSGFFTPGGTINWIARGKSNSWVTGGISSEATSAVFSEFTINHEFVINPTIVVGQDLNVVPDIFEGNNSLKYVFEVELKPTLTDPRSIEARFEDTPGEVGWYNENFNGLDNLYTVNSIVYSDSVTGASLTGIQPLGTTSVAINISRIGGFASGDIAMCYMQRIPTDSSEYINTSTTLLQNLIYDNVRGDIPSLIGNSGNFINYATSINGSGELVITFDYEYSATEAARISPGDQFILSFQHQKAGEDAGNATRAMLLVDNGTYTDQLTVSGLASRVNFRIFQHGMEPTDPPVSGNVITWNEDGIYSTGELSIEHPSTRLTSMRFILAAYKSDEDYFELDSLNIDLTGAIIKDNAQRPNIDQSRGYELINDIPFNQVKINFDRTLGGLSYYTWTCGVKIKWQDWLSNSNVPTEFLDTSQPQDGRNFKTSNYSEEQDYTIKLLVEVNTTGVDTIGRAVVGRDIFVSQDILVYDYDESNDGSITAAVTTFHDIDTGASVGQTPLSNKDSIMRVTWTGSFSDPSDIYVIHRAQPTNASADNIQECSSLMPVRSGQLLKPKDGETGTTVVVNGGTIVSECLVDHTRLNDQAWNFSKRIQSPTIPPPSIDYDEEDYDITNDYS